ncbi:hypothetical protein CN085_27690 [Sinorhizobium meliloti]|uniref:hypothetical protein n=1 Tax=Rhizobium meliloti TaxID=382 RepID=UPI000FDC13F2|nr:hypothetical protein [Sinorhizobium meliloti]RVP09928.1 hypothetical protein CN085_27690 [Sinorhizobium meliloti]
MFKAALRRSFEFVSEKLREHPKSTNFVCFVVGALLSGPIGDLGSAIWTVAREQMFPRSTALVLDFNAVGGCRQGNLAAIGKSFDPAIQLEQGAEMLVVCDTQSLRTTKALAPRDLSIRFPGCLVVQGESLVMLRKSEAVCSLPGDKGFVCDGAKGGKRAPGEIGDPADRVSPCSADILRQFGFS